MSNRLAIILDNLIIYLIKGLVFFLPLFFLSLTLEFFDFNKQCLLWITVPLIVILWMIKKVRYEGTISLKRTPLDIPILTFLLVIFISNLFSQDRFSSFFGYYGRFSDAWLGLLALAVFYFIITNFSSLKEKLSVISLIKLSLYSYSLALLTVFISIFGLWGKILKGTNVFYSQIFNPVSGSLSELASYGLVMTIIIFGLLFFYFNKENSGKKTIWFFRIILFFSLLFLALVNFNFAWWGLLIAGVLFFWFGFKTAEAEGQPWLRGVIFPSVLVIVATIFLIFPLGNLGNFLTGREISKEARLDYKNTASVDFSTLKNHVMLGNGLGTFSYNFSLYRPVGLNKGDLWQFRFNKGGSYFLDLLAETGILGILSYILILSLVFYLSFVSIKNNFFKEINSQVEKNNNKNLFFVLVIALITLVFLQFFSSINTSLLFLFWFILAILMVAGKELLFWTEVKEFCLTRDNKFFKAFDIIIFCFFAGWLILVGFTAKYWLADFYARAGEEENLIKAIRLNINRTDYQGRLVRNYLNEIRGEILKPKNSRDSELIQKAIDNSLDWAKVAVKIRPYSIANQELLAMVYRDVKPFSQGVDVWTVKTFEQATKLEPSNPVLFTELGKAYLEAEMTGEAEKSFLEAIRLKADYKESDFGLAQVYVKKGENEKAITIFDSLAGIYNDERVFYERGRLLYNEGETDKAMEDFLKVLTINPLHSNAMYNVGLALEKKGEKDLALKYFKKVQELNPDSLEVKKKIDEMGK